MSWFKKGDELMAVSKTAWLSSKNGATVVVSEWTLGNNEKSLVSLKCWKHSGQCRQYRIASTKTFCVRQCLDETLEIFGASGYHQSTLEPVWYWFGFGHASGCSLRKLAYAYILKSNATFPDKAPTSSSPLFDHQSIEASPSGNVHLLLRSRKPLTKKNVTLLEEVFSVKSIMEESIGDEAELKSISTDDTTTATTEEDTEAMVSGLKLKLRSNPMRTNNFRKRIQQVVDRLKT
ncbi:unnamed protein product [Prunus armeniaca]|uniref:Uncharacterized protein n=1 Tax=Prunus armeniaca TaxID=36596 RepID=A0A6J5UW28_PRUAR|nr:unnamed protein product [Prunus armeniaca]CAB4310636.1 unnamed protein product [Prunus armeniaca]